MSKIPMEIVIAKHLFIIRNRSQIFSLMIKNKDLQTSNLRSKANLEENFLF